MICTICTIGTFFVLPWMAVYIRYLKIIRIDHMISGNNYLSLIRLILWFKIGLATILELWVGFFRLNSNVNWSVLSICPGLESLLVQLWNYHVHCRISSYIKCLYTLSLFIRRISLIDFTMYFRLIPQNPFRTVKYLTFRQTAAIKLIFVISGFMFINIHQHTKMKSGLFQTKLGIWRRIIVKVGHITGHIFSNWFTFGNFERILEIDKGSRIRLSENEYSNW